MIEPKKIDFILYQGATWEHTFVVLDLVTNLPKDITGCTAKLQAREEPDVASSVVINLDAQIGGVNGQIKFIIDPTMTEGQVWETVGYDAELLWPSTKKDKIAVGKFKLLREYTFV